MVDYGVQPTGFVRKTFEVLAAELRTSLRTLWGANVNLSPTSLLGQLIDTTAVKLAEEWEVSAAAYASMDPDQAEDAALDSVSAITGTTRDAATKTRVLADVNVDPGTYAIGELVAHVTGDPERRFSNLNAITNGTAGAVTYSDEDFEAEETGPVSCNAGTLEVMANAVSGWNSVTNNADAYSLGTAVETDASLRAKREEELGSQGSTNADAIRADLLRVEGVLRCTVLQNDTDTTDANGLLPHSIEAIVYGPAATDADIAAEIFATKAGGANTNGTTTVVVTDAQGFTHEIKFTRPTTVRVYVEVDLTVLDTYAGDDAIETAFAAADADFGPGDVLYWSKVICIPYGDEDTDYGVESVDDFGLSLDGITFTQANITPTIRQVVSIDSADVTVNS